MSKKNSGDRPTLFKFGDNFEVKGRFEIDNLNVVGEVDVVKGGDGVRLGEFKAANININQYSPELVAQIDQVFKDKRDHKLFPKFLELLQASANAATVGALAAQILGGG